MPRFPIPRCIAGKLTAKRSALAQAKGTAAPASRSHRAIALGIACQSLASCSGVQSALAPAAEEAEQVATLFWVMAAGGFIIWLLVVALSLYASRRNSRPVGERAAGRLIVLGGVVLPVTVLTALLSYTLWLMPSLRPFAGGEGVDLRVEIVGHQFWWEVLYHRQDGSTVVSANEVRLPAGERVEFELTSSDMIHSFWIPALGGKMDLVPGRINRMSFRPTKTGTYRGQCAEFCGTSHARMAFPVVVMQPADLDAWLDERSGSSAGFGTNVEGRRVFDREQCGQCHRIDGAAGGLFKGPDLSHVGSRLTIGAGYLNNTTDQLARFIVNPGSVKPGAHMPASPHLSALELDQLASWLKGLR